VVTKDNLQLDELLAQGHLGGPQYDRILDRVLEQTAPRRSWWRRRRMTAALLPGLALASALGAWLMLARPAVEHFAPKGTAWAPLAGAVEIGCAPSGGHVCPAGGTLLFKVNAAVISGYLGAYAERAGAPPSERIWYFPTAAGTGPVIARGEGTLVVPEGIRLGPEHRPGRYRITVWISSRPLGRSDIDGGAGRAILSRGVFDLEVTP
jgi:hypothetical protein